MKSFWINLAVKDLEKAGAFYKAIGFNIADYGDVKSVTLKGGGNLIICETPLFNQRTPFKIAEEGNEVLISLDVDTNEEVDTLIERVRQNGGTITNEPNGQFGFYGASFTDLDNHHFNVIVMS